MPTSLRSAGIQLPLAPPTAAPRPAILGLASRIAELTEQLPVSELPVAAAEALQAFLDEPDLLDRAHQMGDTNQYRRHLLYADALRSFTILALVWTEGQGTPVHGHTAWGAVGIYQGRLETRNYELIDTGCGLPTCSETLYCETVPGDILLVKPGLGGIHRLSCHAAEGAISIHVYGRDLCRDPASINIALPQTRFYIS